MLVIHMRRSKMKKKLLMMSLVLMSAFSANAANLVGPCVQHFLKDKDVSGWITNLYVNNGGIAIKIIGDYSSIGTNGKENDLLRCERERERLINQGYQPSLQLEVNAD